MKTTSPTRRISRIILLLVACIAVSLLGACMAKLSMPQREETIASQTAEQAIQPTAQGAQPKEPIFCFEAIPEEVRRNMMGVTISETSPVSFDDLAYLTLSYIGYDNQSHMGHLVVDKTLAEEVICIFKELYDIRFPIEKMRLPYEYDGIDELSMRDNNTSAFNDRPIEGSGGLSYHQLGRAIDINPLVNPYIKFSTGEVLPNTASEYLDRTLGQQGMILEDSACVTIFKKYGWTWGGNWTSLKDYQHFEKQ